MRRELRTQIALQVQDLAQTFNDAFAKTRISPGDYVPELTAPDGPSTGGGVQALQRLRLVPKQPGFPTLVVGSANQPAGTAELRSYKNYVDALHMQHFKKPVALDPAEYEKFLSLARGLLMALRLQPTLTEALKLSTRPPPRSKIGMLIGIAFTIAAAVLGAVGMWIYLKGR